MNEQNFFEEFREAEQTRIEKSIEKAKDVVLMDHFSSIENTTIEEIRDFEKLLNQLQGLLSLAADKFFENLPSPLKKIRERSIWEVYLSGLKYLFRKYPQGFFRKTNLALEELNDILNNVDSYSYKCLEEFCDITDLAREFEKFCENYRKGKKIVQQYKDWNENQDIVRLYASIKTWSRDEEFQIFENRFHKARKQIFEMIIEGPIQLYLVISEGNWFSFLKILTLEHLQNFSTDKNKKELQDLREVNKAIYKTIENSTTYKIFKRLVEESLKIYVNDYLQDEKRVRTEYPTDDLRRRFIKRFESEELFRN